jgi:hypothetical protein
MMLLPFKRSQKIVINELSLGAVDKRFIDKFDGRGWKGDVKGICSIVRNSRPSDGELKIIARKQLFQSVKGYINK